MYGTGWMAGNNYNYHASVPTCATLEPFHSASSVQGVGAAQQAIGWAGTAALVTYEDEVCLPA